VEACRSFGHGVLMRGAWTAVLPACAYRDDSVAATHFPSGASAGYGFMAQLQARWLKCRVLETSYAWGFRCLI